MMRKLVVLILTFFMAPFSSLAQSDTVVYRFPLWAIAIPVGISIVLLAGVVILLRTKHLKALALVPLFFLLLSGGLFAPLMILDRVEVSSTRIQQTTGFWWEPTRKGFSYADVKKVRIRQKRVGPKKRWATVWEVYYKNGQIIDIDPGDLWEMNSYDIIPRLRKYGMIIIR